jgi:hypothetical protein
MWRSVALLTTDDSKEGTAMFLRNVGSYKSQAASYLTRRHSSFRVEFVWKTRWCNRLEIVSSDKFWIDNAEKRAVTQITKWYVTKNVTESWCWKWLRKALVYTIRIRSFGVNVGCSRKHKTWFMGTCYIITEIKHSSAAWGLHQLAPGPLWTYSYKLISI